MENAVGGHLLNHLHETAGELYYWRQRDFEVDFVLKTAEKTVAIEVKSSRPRVSKGLEAFLKRYPKAVPVIIGPGGIALEEFFTMSLDKLPGL